MGVLVFLRSWALGEQVAPLSPDRHWLRSRRSAEVKRSGFRGSKRDASPTVEHVEVEHASVYITSAAKQSKAGSSLRLEMEMNADCNDISRRRW